MRILKIVDKPKLWSNEWFECWQVPLLIAINFPVKSIREEVRHRLGIILDRNILVDRLLRNSFRIKIGEREYQETFYGKPVFAIALKREWNFIWQLIHKWDMNFANKLFPKLNLGFDTLTAYPDADGGFGPMDGYVITGPTDATFATIRAAAGTSQNTSSTFAQIRLTASTTTNQFQYNYRGMALFTTSALTSGAIISEAIFGAYYSNKGNGLGSPDLHVCASTPAQTYYLDVADYSQFGSVSFGSCSYANFTASQYNDITLDANGRANISKTGISKFGLLTNWDINNSFTGTWVSAGSSYLFVKTADAGVGYQPKLVTTYTLPSTFVPQIVMS